MQDNVQQGHAAVRIFKLHESSQPVRVDSGRLKCQVLAQAPQQLPIPLRLQHIRADDFQQPVIQLRVQHRLVISALRLRPSFHVLRQRRNDQELKDYESAVDEEQSLD